MSNTLENMSFEELLKVNKNLEMQKNILETKASNLEVKTAILEKMASNLETQKSNLETLAIKLQAKVDYMQFQIDQLNRLLFGAKRERFVSQTDEKQLKLPFDVEEVQTPEKQQEVITYVRQKTKRENHPGRIALPDHLPVEEIIIEPTEDTTNLKCIGKEITDQLELIPAKLFIKRYIRPKYIKPTDNELLNHKGIIADLPTFPIEKGIAGSGLLAQIMIDKFVDHLPIYRQIERFKREKITIPSSTINGWQDAVCNLLEPLYETLKHRVLSQGYLQVDETPIQVLDKSKKGKTHRGYHWVYYSPIEKTVLFDYRDGRNREGPTELLANFKGYLQTDAYGVYDTFGKNKDITQLNCMAHARRGFEKALEYDKAKAEIAMEMFQQVYAVEAKAREQNLTADQRYELRLNEALPILNQLSKWIVETYKTSLPKSALGKATA